MRARVVAAARSFRRSAAPRAAPSSPGGRSRPSRRCACSSPWTSRSCCWRSARGRSSSASRRGARAWTAAARRSAVLELRPREVPQQFEPPRWGAWRPTPRRARRRHRLHRARRLLRPPPRPTAAPPLRDRRLDGPLAHAFLRRHANATFAGLDLAPIPPPPRRAAAAVRARAQIFAGDLRRTVLAAPQLRDCDALVIDVSEATHVPASTCGCSGSPTCPTRCGCWTVARGGSSSSTARRAPRYPWRTAATPAVLAAATGASIGMRSWRAPSSSARWSATTSTRIGGGAPLPWPATRSASASRRCSPPAARSLRRRRQRQHRRRRQPVRPLLFGGRLLERRDERRGRACSSRMAARRAGWPPRRHPTASVWRASVVLGRIGAQRDDPQPRRVARGGGRPPRRRLLASWVGSTTRRPPTSVRACGPCAPACGSSTIGGAPPPPRPSGCWTATTPDASSDGASSSPTCSPASASSTAASPWCATRPPGDI